MDAPIVTTNLMSLHQIVTTVVPPHCFCSDVNLSE